MPAGNPIVLQLFKTIRLGACLKGRCFVFQSKDGSCMKSAKKILLEETEKILSNYAYKIVYVPHEIIEDYNATYNVMCEDRPITTNAAKELAVPLNEIWISEKWKPYAKYIVFHELREIYYRAKGFERDDAHEKAIEDQLILWRNDRLFLKMVRDMEETDRKTAEKKRRLKSLK